MTKTTPSVEVVTMTPKWANELLRKNTHNRRLRSGQVERLVRAIAMGEWELNGDAIRLTTDGQLLDGQHRLSAIVAANTSVPLVLFRGLEESAQLTIDLGARRKFSDVLVMNGERHAIILAAITRAYARYLSGDFTTNKSTSRVVHSPQELLRCLEEHPKLRDSAHVSVALRSGVLLPQSVTGFCHRVLEDLDPEDAHWFFSHLQSGMGLGTDGRTYAILKLRDFGNSRASLERREQKVYIATMIKAWNMFRDGRTSGSVVWRGGGAMPEPWPEPK